MTLTVLTDDQIKAILESLSLSELDEFRHVLSSALHAYATGAEGSEESPFQQPHRVSTLHSKSKATTLYMPSCGPDGMGCKVVSLTRGEAAKDPSVSPISPTGVVNLFSPDGKPIGLLHASTLTAFRTALSSTGLLTRRNHVKTITVFGSGSQAYWHVRLALMMRGSTIRNVNVINRRFSDSAGGILRQFMAIPADVREREGWAKTEFSLLTPSFNEYPRLLKEYIRAADVIYCCTPSNEDLFEASVLTSHEGRRKGRLIVAIGSYTPDMRELPEELLLQAIKAQDKSHRHFHKHADEGGVIIVDTLEGALKEAGEIIAANISPNFLVEIGELLMLKQLSINESDTDSSISQTSTNDLTDLADGRSSMSSVYGDQQQQRQSSRSPTRSASPSAKSSGLRLPFRRNSGSSFEQEKKKKEDSLSRWLRDGTVIYKCVGLGLMDLVIGSHIVKVAKEKQVGTQVEGF